MPHHLVERVLEVGVWRIHGTQLGQAFQAQVLVKRHQARQRRCHAFRVRHTCAHTPVTLRINQK
ncbi:hypothetical protein D3C81_1909200 [compost metagenome]